MKQPKCFGTMLWDAADRHCRECDAFQACRDMFEQEVKPLTAEPDADESHSPRSRMRTPDDSAPLHAEIERAFSTNPAVEADWSRYSQAIETPRSHAPDSAALPKMVHFSTRLPRGLDVDLKVYCALHKMTVQAFISAAIRAKLDK